MHMMDEYQEMTTYKGERTETISGIWWSLNGQC